MFEESDKDLNTESMKKAEHIEEDEPECEEKITNKATYKEPEEDDEVFLNPPYEQRFSELNRLQTDIPSALSSPSSSSSGLSQRTNSQSMSSSLASVSSSGSTGKINEILDAKKHKYADRTSQNELKLKKDRRILSETIGNKSKPSKLTNVKMARFFN